jgi:lysyl-tRNA synthetase, class I
MAYGMVKGVSSDLAERVRWAVKWSSREGQPPRPHVKLNSKAKKAVAQFAKAIAGLSDPTMIQNAAFDAVKANGLTPAEFFPVIYSILIGSDRGPRLGPYVLDYGAPAVSRSLLSAIR